MLKKLPSIIEKHPLAVLLYDKRTRLIRFGNKAAGKLFGYRPAAWSQGLRIDDLIVTVRAANGKNSFRGTGIRKNGERFALKADFSTHREKGRMLQLVVVSESLRKSAPRRRSWDSLLQRIVNVSHNEIYLVSTRTLRFEYANKSALENLGYTSGELYDIRLTDIFRFPDEMALQALLSSLRTSDGGRLQLQLKFTRKDASQYDVDVIIREFKEDRLLLVIANDITDKVIAERKLLGTVHEKETLIKEIHHRVKNNLQLISSIIYLKLASVERSDIRTFLEDTRQKIRSIALIHERLLQTEKLDKVEISDYLGKLTHDLQVTYFREDLALEIKTAVPDKMINLDVAIICGLIVNELVTNAMKHAFQGRARGSIEIAFSENGGGKYLLSVSDDGVSLPSHIIPGGTKSFGMQLVDVFVKQLGGSVDINREKGTTFQIHF